jgi:hypothetical protein
LKIQIPIYWLLEFWFCGFVNGIETCATDPPQAEWEGLNHTDKSEDLPCMQNSLKLSGNKAARI